MAGKVSRGARARSRARRLVLQGMYQWQMSGASVGDIVVQLLATQNIKDTDTEYFEELLRATIAASDNLDTMVSHYIDRPSAQLDPIERGILLLGACELRTRPDVPHRVVLNEAVELAKKFGAQDGHKYINAVLDRVAAELRKAER